MSMLLRIVRFFNRLRQKSTQKKEEEQSRRALIHKRAFGHSLPYVDSAKRYGNDGEDVVIEALLEGVPSAQIKRNVVIEAPQGNAEIDCVVLYRDCLFAIEIKSWRGRIVEGTNGFYKQKIDRYTDEMYTKIYKSPFKQLERAIYLLKKQFPARAWILPIVFFEGADEREIELLTDATYFTACDNLVQYIRTKGEASTQARALFRACVPGDVLYGIGYQQRNVGVIDRSTLIFSTEYGVVAADRIQSIRIRHTPLYDELRIRKTDGVECVTRESNKSIRVRINGVTDTYALSKIDYIELGHSQC